MASPGMWFTFTTPLTGTAQLTHLEQFALHVTRVLRRGEPVAQIIGCLAVSVDINSIGGGVSEKVDDRDHMEQLDGTVGERNQL